ncbi:unnamed protein product [Cuscuta epithymum]|uniref:Pre-rRNA-processing protein TSR2 homolog n=1 Tax=Cuscuta epithymum TaxID=186058 RepID=A0AAV0D958_9ASTE|nr:unnamed protein product [Cuscuta epithymum]
MNSENNPPPPLTAEAVAQLQEGIALVLARWASLRIAVEQEWGGPTSREKYDDLAARIFSFFTQSKEKVYVYDLEDILDDVMISSFNTELEDGSIEEVAEELMNIHAQCAEGNFECIIDLKRTMPLNSAETYKRQFVINEDDEDDDGVDGDVENGMLENDSLDMEVDSSEHQTSVGQRGMLVDESMAATATEDGWTVVSSRRKNGRRN